MTEYFGNNRYAYIKEKSNPPRADDVIIDDKRQVAMVKGRVKTRSTGGAAVKLYKHGDADTMDCTSGVI